ncbi:MAG: sensor histidine kinase [Actinomycetota bacterium]|nr:sensor histidine kinase [Candidatus Dormibacteraeota bacterium]MDQ6945139.1 sensor histidine kinase [Actinomycetota bacterium]
MPDEPVHARVDGIRTSAIVSNLIDNAIKYSPSGGRLQVEVLGAAWGSAAVRVKDEGLSIDANDQARLFSRFGRIVTADNSHIPGSGLGLYLAQRVARLQGGDLVLEVSKPGFGSSFRLDLVLPVGTSSLRLGKLANTTDLVRCYC